jgi:nucleoside-diphosphate-sugar epimerase
MIHVAVTGAAGFIGLNTVREALRRGWRVDAWIHRASQPELELLAAQGAVRVRRVDLAEPAAVREAFGCGDRPDAVIHCAGRASDVGWTRAFRRANYASVVNLGRYCEAAGVARFVFISTTDVYGLRDFKGEGEDELPYDVSARNPYPRFKIMAEQWLRAHMPPERYAIIRPAAVWGEGDPTLTPRFRAFLASSPYIVHFGRWQGRNRWPLADVRTVAAANCLAATRSEAAGLAINVLDTPYTTLEDFYRQLAARYFPARHFRTITLPYALGAALGGVVSTVSTMFNLAHPFTDPSLYALRSISHNLDFSNARLCGLFRQAGEELP